MATLPDRDQQQRNAATIEQLLRTKAKVLRRQADRHAQRFEEVDDVLQRAYELFIERYSPPYEPLPWLMTTIKHEAWGRVKLAHRRREIPISTEDACGEGYDLAQCIPDPACGPDEIAFDRELDDELRRLLDRLKPDERTALLLFACGYSYGEIGAIKGWTYTKVNRCINEGRAAIRSARRDA